MNTSGMGYKILDERYALLECLAVSGVGEIYRGRDLDLAQTESAPSRILIHLLPSGYQLANISSQITQAKALTQALNKAWILPILTHGQMGDRQYVVLQSPEGLGAHSVMSLPSQQLPSSAKLAQQFASLVKAKQLPEILDSALLIALPNQSLFLLASALIPNIYTLRARHTGLTLYKSAALKRTVALAGIMAITLSTFAFEYRAKPEDRSTQAAEKPLSTLVSPQVLFDQAAQTALQDKPIQNQSLNLPLALQEPLPAIEPPLFKLKTQPELEPPSATVAVNPEPTSETLALVEIPKKTEDSAANSNKQSNNKAEENTKTTPKIKTTLLKQAEMVVTASPAAAYPASEGAIYHTANVEMAPVARAKQVPNTAAQKTLSLDELIERANRALADQNFSSKNGVIFYTRQIKIRNHLHPQIERLGRFSVMYQHELARNRLRADEPQQAHKLLTNSKNLIQEFNLKSLNSAQQVLEHKSNQSN
ncbi:MAG: hypothetical protein WBP46_12075 [Thiolinea sp.]|mgnify:CR=1 FL=1